MSLFLVAHNFAETLSVQVTRTLLVDLPVVTQDLLNLHQLTILAVSSDRRVVTQEHLSLCPSADQTLIIVLNPSATECLFSSSCLSGALHVSSKVG